ncbi:MAG TPA: kelch repeat-containing protein [Tenuifilaceae bacterium]|nr:kelch repeat-containing protein [Tenuifilaceae bacterium]
MKVASLPDKGREGSIAFSINGKGYVCLGYQATGEYFNDLYEYDPESDRWTKKSNFPGNTKYYSLCLVIDNKAYIGLGLDVNISLSQFWEYDPACDSWTQKASFGGGTRMGATGFSIGNKGYVGGGTLSWANDPLNDFWEYDTTTDTWKRIADFPGVNRAWASGFTINNKGYVGAGSWVNNYYNDFWRYDPIDNKWIRIADITYERRVSKFFIIDNIGYSYSGGVSVNDNFIIFNPNF